MWVGSIGVALGQTIPADQSGLLPGGVESGLSVTPSQTLGEQSARHARALALYYEGIKFALQGNPQAATERYLEVLKLDPTNVALAKRLADTYVLADQITDAMAMLENAIQSNPDKPEAYIYLSEFCARYHHNSEEIKARGLAVAREAVERFPHEAQVHANLAALLLFDNQAEEAVKVIEAAAAREEASPRYWIRLAGVATQVWPVRNPEGREKVLRLYRKAQSLAGEDSQVWEDVADFLAMIKEMDEASALYRRVVMARPDDLKAREKLGHVLTLSGKQDEAAEVWKQLLEIDPQSENAHSALARYFAAKGDVRESAKHRAVAFRWQGREALGEALRLVREMIEAELYEEALPVLERAEFNAPSAAEPPFFTAVILYHLERFHDAVAAYGRAASVAEAQGEKGKEALREDFYFQWAMACERIGQFDEAEKHFQNAIERVPAESPELAAKSYNALAYMWLDSGRRVDEAGPLIERALKFDPENAAYLDTQGWFYFKRGEFAQAVTMLQRAEKAADQPIAEIIDHIAQAHWALGQKTEAVSTLERAIALPDATEIMRRRLAEWQSGVE